MTKANEKVSDAFTSIYPKRLGLNRIKRGVAQKNKRTQFWQFSKNKMFCVAAIMLGNGYNVK